MFSASNKTPKVYETQGPASGNLALLMKALSNLGTGAQGISRSAGTSVAEDRLAALSPEERQELNLSDKFQGLSLTDDFRNKLAQADKDAMSAKVTADKNDFTTKRDKTLHGYNMSRDAARDARTTARINAGKEPTAPKMTDEEMRNAEIALGQYDMKIAEYESAMTAKDTTDGIGLSQKQADTEGLKREKMKLLQQMGYDKKTAREMTYKESAATKDLLKWVSGNANINKK